MEWVQTTAKTVEEAKELALDQLGVAEDDAEFEVMEEPRPGLFGRVRGEARVRARVRPSRPRPKLDRRERRRRHAGEDSGDAPVTATGDERDEPSPTTSAAEPNGQGRAGFGREDAPEQGGDRSQHDDQEQEGDGERGNGAGIETVAASATSFLAGLAAALGVEATTAVGGAGNELEVRLDGDDLGLLIGPRGQTLLAVQDLVRSVSQRNVVDHGRLHLDVGGYRERRRAALARFTTDVAEQVTSTGVPRMLEPMASADRKVVHDTAATIEGVSTRSEGEEPNRRVVILPA